MLNLDKRVVQGSGSENVNEINLARGVTLVSYSGTKSIGGAYCGPKVTSLRGSDVINQMVASKSRENMQALNKCI